jgi:hypothetical protein
MPYQRVEGVASGAGADAIDKQAGLGIALPRREGVDTRGRWSDDVFHTLLDRHLAARNLQQLVGVQLCPMAQQQWLAAQNGLCIVYNASDVRHSSVFDLAEKLGSALCVRRLVC